MEIYVGKNGRVFGPYKLEEIQRRVNEGRIDGSELAWHEGLKSWFELSNLLGINLPDKSEDTEGEPTKSVSGNEPKIWILRGDDQSGPFPADHIRKSLNDGQLKGSELAWHKDLVDWIDVRKLLDQLDAKEETKSVVHN